MKTTSRALLATVLACTLAACHIPDATMENAAIQLYGDMVSLHVDGAPAANIAANGDLAIDGKPVAITPVERSLLMQYNRSVRAVHDTGQDMGKAGIEIAAKAITVAATSSSGNPDDPTGNGPSRMEKLGQNICQDTASIKVAQDQLATQLAAFKPYAGIVSADDVTSCTSD